MIKAIMDSINNHFLHTHNHVNCCLNGNFVNCSTENFLVGQYIIIRNSILNDGVYKILEINEHGITVDTELFAECGEFCIFGLAVPKDFLNLVGEIEEWQKNHNKVAGVASESTGSYSISFDNNANTWQKAFKDRLHIYRKVFSDFAKY